MSNNTNTAAVIEVEVVKAFDYSKAIKANEGLTSLLVKSVRSQALAYAKIGQSLSGCTDGQRTIAAALSTSPSTVQRAMRLAAMDDLDAKLDAFEGTSFEKFLASLGTPRTPAAPAKFSAKSVAAKVQADLLKKYSKAQVKAILAQLAQ